MEVDKVKHLRGSAEEKYKTVASTNKCVWETSGGFDLCPVLYDLRTMHT